MAPELSTANKRTKKHNISADYIDRSAKTGVSQSFNELETNLSSLEESKRRSACILLSEIFSSGIEKSTSVLSTARFLSKLSMRLLDTSVQVRLHAGIAMKYLSQSSDAEVSARIVSCGIFKTMISICLDDTSLRIERGDFLECILMSVAEIIAKSGDAVKELENRSSEIVPFLILVLSDRFTASLDSTIDMSKIRAASVSALNSITSRSSQLASQLTENDINTLWSYIDSFHILTNPSGLAMQLKIDENNIDIWGMAMKVMEVIGNTFLSHCATGSTLSVRGSAEMDMYRIHTMVIIIREVLQCCHGDINHQNIAVKIGEGDQDSHSMITTEAPTDSTNEAAVTVELEKFHSLDLLKMALDLATSLMSPSAKMSSEGQDVDDVGSMQIDSETDAKTDHGGDINAKIVQLFQSENILWWCSQCVQSIYSTLKEELSKINDTDAIATNTTTASSSPRPFLVSYKAYAYLMSLDQLAGVFDSCCTTSMQAENSSPLDYDLLDVMGIRSVLLYLLEVTTKTTRSKDETSQVASDWLVADGINKKACRETIISLTVTFIDYLSNILKLSFLGLYPSTSVTMKWIEVKSEENLKQVALLLVQCISSPIFELAAAGVAAVGLLGQRDSQMATTDVPANTASASTVRMLLYSKSVNFLLTNALLRRLATPNAFAVTARNLMYNGKPLSSNHNKKQNKSITANESYELSQKENIELSTLRLIDVSFNAMVDLHASDDIQYLNNFMALHCVEKLKERFQDFGNRLSNCSVGLNEDDVDTFEVTIQNIDNFLQYKEKEIFMTTMRN
mmetsp:Transcript_21132/g.29328  ORF Transcript_21132/g.29328 Transcript_21132/m.29328 type:complete len:796 (-) Transcript_21132:111-2498(-)